MGTRIGAPIGSAQTDSQEPENIQRPNLNMDNGNMEVNRERTRNGATILECRNGLGMNRWQGINGQILFLLPTLVLFAFKY